PATARPRGRVFAAIGALLLLFIGTYVLWIGRAHQPEAILPVSPRLAVLPFRPLAVADGSESLELGMTETLISGLNGDGLAVQPLSAVRRFAGVEQDALLAGRELEVSAVLEGYIQRDAERLRVSARLLDVASGRQLWASSYDEPFTDIFSVQDAIAGRVRRALEYFGQAIALDPNFAAAYAGEAEAYSTLAVFGMAAPHDVFPLAQRA